MLYITCLLYVTPYWLKIYSGGRPTIRTNNTYSLWVSFSFVIVFIQNLFLLFYNAKFHTRLLCSKMVKRVCHSNTNTTFDNTNQKSRLQIQHTKNNWRRSNIKYRQNRDKTLALQIRRPSSAPWMRTREAIYWNIYLFNTFIIHRKIPNNQVLWT